jgi:hypothetical protein
MNKLIAILYNNNEIIPKKYKAMEVNLGFYVSSSSNVLKELKIIESH